MLKENISATRIIIGVIIGWLVYVCTYIYLKNILNLYMFSAYFLLIGESSLDILIVTLTFILWKISEKKPTRDIFLYFCISFAFSLAADFIYNVVLNLLNFQYINPYVISFFDFPFALFLVFQLTGWGLILFSNREYTIKNRRATYIPYVFVSLLMFFMFIFGIPWKIEYLSLIGVFQLVDTVFEVMGFALVTICLARAKTRSIRLLGAGYLLVVSSDFVIRYHVVSGVTPYLSPLETTWILGLLLICLGFVSIKQDKINETFKLLPANSLQSLVAIWLLILWLLSVFLYMSLYYIFSYNNIYDFNQITRSFISMLVPFSVLVIISSGYLSKKISSSLAMLENNISKLVEFDRKSISNYIMENDIINGHINSKDKTFDDSFELHEVEKLKIFIMNTIDELRSANRVKSEFLMSMSHDFRTPASGIYHMSRVVHRKLEDEELKKLQQLIVDSSGQLMKYLEDILDFSRLENDTFELNTNKIDIIEMIDDLIIFLSAKAKEKMLTIHSEFLEPSINYIGDRLMIHRVLLNLISNAIKFTHKGGVVISAHQEEMDAKSWLIIRIKDTGIGIDECHHKLIFEPFTCLTSPETATYQGIGLGLSNVLLILKKIGGKITLESRPNQGSIFGVFLPI